MTAERGTTFVPLAGSRRDLLPGSRPTGSVDPREIVSVTVRVRSAGDPAQLERHVRELYEKPLAAREYLTYEALAERHGARAADLDAVERYAQRHNLFVSHRSAARRSLTLTGQLGDLLDAFHADLHMYDHAGGPYRGRRGEILIPEPLAGIITGVFGFDTRPKHRSPYRHRAGVITNDHGPGGKNGVSPTEFAKRYNFPTQHGGVSFDGSGECVAIIELGGGFANTDLDLYFREIGRPRPNVVAVSVDHAGNHPTPHGGADGEVMLDVEVVGAVAPGANIAVYFAPNKGNGFLDAISAAVHDTERRPSVVSISWGGPEAPEDKQALTAYHEVFVEAAALGITVCAASGDHGTADLSHTDWDGKIHVDHPAVDDFVLGCGGTQIDAKGRDVVWNDGTPFADVYGGGGWASGGGISAMFPVPDYQRKANKLKSIATGKPGRGVPDVAMSATNYFTRVQRSDEPSAGTSAVAPLMSALVVLLNQAKGKRVGFLNPFLYANAAKGAVKDVTAGTNAIADTCHGYTARKGWDPCTGLGTPDGAAILKLL